MFYLIYVILPLLLMIVVPLGGSVLLTIWTLRWLTRWDFWNNLCEEKDLIVKIALGIPLAALFYYAILWLMDGTVYGTVN